MIAALGLLASLIADIVASRARARRVTAYGIGLVAGFAVTAGLLFAISAETATVGIAILAYCSWWFAFLNLAQALESSLRVRLLGEIYAAGGRMPKADLEARYNDAILLRLRLERLLAHGAAVERQGHLHIVSPGLKAIAAFFRILKKVLLGRTSEFGTRHS